ncbi:MAG: hypothetical protein ABSH34_04520 [Verrucomicrobiota bacterium]
MRPGIGRVFVPGLRLRAGIGNALPPLGEQPLSHSRIDRLTLILLERLQDCCPVLRRFQHRALQAQAGDTLRFPAPSRDFFPLIQQLQHRLAFLGRTITAAFRHQQLLRAPRLLRGPSEQTGQRQFNESLGCAKILA